ncbi:MAG: hypothetical protein HS117_13555 [Verrucomicrobiaceae bacterium]|nr:hypothetical protein [Verrucomicrobiaceae bacterium]
MIARTILEARIAEVREALRKARLLRHLAAVFLVGIVVRGALLLAVWQGVTIPRPLDRWSMLALIALAVIAWLKGRRNIWSDREIARMIEEKHPVLDSLLLTAIDHEPQAKEPSSFLHERVIDQALARAATQNWPVTVAQRPYSRALVAAWAVVIGFMAIELTHRLRPEPAAPPAAALATETAPAAPTEFKVTLTPGDTEIERGSRLIVEARFDGPVPEDATLVIQETDGKPRDTLPMRLTVDGQVFGGLIAKVDRDATYHVEFAGQKSPTHTIRVFDYPALVRADAVVTPPEYTKLPPKETKNTQKVTALEGSKVTWRIQVNKPLVMEDAARPAGTHLTAAELFGEDKTVIALTPTAGDATLLEGVLTAEKTQKYRLHLVDEAERANKNPPWFTVTVQSNQLAKIEVVFPKRDIQVSSIQELPVEAKVSDDLGVTKSGAVFSINGNSKEILFQHPVTAPLKKQDVRAELTLEKENAQPRQLVSYYLWAEDTGPKGEVRRSMSDMFFADIRHFEDIFREAEAPPAEPGQPKPKGQTDKLVDLVKQIVNATWRLIRDTNAGRAMEAAAPDVDVVNESVGIALEQVKEGMEEAEDAEIKQALTEAWKSLKDAQPPLQQASEEKKRSPLNQALAFEQSALEWLHRAQSREHQVMRQNQPQMAAASASQQQQQNQLMDLELKQKEQRYEEEKAATEEQTAEQQENLQVLNRLKELARRQEALAEKMKELQNQLAEAKSEQEKQELENQLKRLQAEQEQLLRDLDDLKDRMEKPENAQQMAEAKEQLEKTREQVNEAAEQLKNEQLADATNSATRAQRELEQMQEDFRQKTGKKFAEDVKQLRQQARQAADAQKKISEAIENQKTPDAADAGDSAADLARTLNNSQLGRQVAEQQENIEKLLNNMRQLSEQSEQSEPLLHRNLYDAVRQAQTGGLEENLQETRDQLRYGSRAGAQDAERKAANSVGQLQKGVEKAAESVLGSESEALRVARNELDRLIKEAQEEENTAQRGQQASDASDKSGPPDTKSQNAEGQDQNAPQDPKVAEKATQSGKGQMGQKPGEQSEPGEKGEGQGQGRGEPQDPKTAQNSRQPGEAQQGQQPGEKGKSEGQSGQQPGDRGQGKNESQPQMAQGGQGQQPGEGQRPGEQGQGQQQAQAEGQGQSQGRQQGQDQQQARNSSPREGQQPGGQQRGEGRGEGARQQAAEDGSRRPPEGPGRERSSNAGNRMAGGSTSGGGDNSRGASFSGGLFFDDTQEQPDRGLFTGEGYDRWSDRLRNVEELLNNPELRNEAAKILDRARDLRVESRRNNEAPQVAHLNQRITQPLVELRDRVAEELAKKDAGKNLAPVDRDPVPAEFRDLVKRYYKELGAGK